MERLAPRCIRKTPRTTPWAGAAGVLWPPALRPARRCAAAGAFFFAAAGAFFFAAAGAFFARPRGREDVFEVSWALSEAREVPSGGMASKFMRLQFRRPSIDRGLFDGGVSIEGCSEARDVPSGVRAVLHHSKAASQQGSVTARQHHSKAGPQQGSIRG